MTNLLRPLTISITTRNRPDRVIACLRSLRVIEKYIARAIVLDDVSDQPIEPLVRAEFAGDHPFPILVLREETKIGPVRGKNKLARAAETEFIFNLDDDTVLLDATGVETTLSWMRADLRIAAIGFPQGALDGKPYQPLYQPAPVEYSCQVACFTGYAYITRREIFVERLGGYRELIDLLGEEKEFGLRALDAGYIILYLPSAVVAHFHDLRGRDQKALLRQTVQSSCLQFIYNQPFALVIPGIIARLLLYWKERRAGQIRDPWGTLWVLGRVFSMLPAALRERKPVRWSTLRRWREIRKSPPRYPAFTPNNGSPV